MWRFDNDDCAAGIDDMPLAHSHAMSLCREYAWPFLLYTLHIGGHEDTVTRVTTRHPGQLVFYKLHSDIVTCVSEKQAHSSL